MYVKRVYYVRINNSEVLEQICLKSGINADLIAQHLSAMACELKEK